MARNNRSTLWLCVACVVLFMSACGTKSSEDRGSAADATDALDATLKDAEPAVSSRDVVGEDTGPYGKDVEATSADAEEPTDADTPDADTPDADTPGVQPPQIWRPAPNTTWHWQLQGDLDTTLAVDAYDIDLFDTPSQTIAALQTRGVHVICYFSAGSYEDWRPDAGDFEPNDYGGAMGNWPGEWWLDIRSANVRAIMEARLDLAASKGCDAVEPDNVDGYQNTTDLDLSETDQIDYNRFLAGEAHARALSIGLKNAVGLVDTLEADFDWALNESCLEYDECAMLRPFIDAGKAVFHAEYVDAIGEASAKQAEVCDEASIADFSTLIFTWDLDGWAVGCP